MFKKNYFYLLEYYDNNNEKKTKAGILEKTKRVKTELDMRLALIKIIADIEEEIEKECEIEFKITNYKILNFNLV